MTWPSMMVSQNLTRADVEAPASRDRIPASVVDMLHGDLGQPPGGWPAALQKKALNDEPPITVRPGSLLKDIDFAAERANAEKACGRQIDDQEFASYLMYPKVFVEFAAAQRKYGPVAVLPTLTFFYGMKLEDELSIEIEDGKSLVVRLVALGETDDEGQVQVFFELNGQPRTIKVPNRSAVATRPARRKAEDGNDNQVAAPMPGLISMVSVKAGRLSKPATSCSPSRR
ncbi:MAG: hypothetical protein WDN29_15190 [Methylovirgula sp.]